jgi:hypothetical protein
VLQGIEKYIERAARQVGPAYGPDEEGVSGKKVSLTIEADTARGMAGGIDDLEGLFPKGEAIAVLDPSVNRGGGTEAHLAGYLPGRRGIKKPGIGFVHDDLHPCFSGQELITAGVVGMAMGIDQIEGPQIQSRYFAENAVFIAGRIDQDALPRFFTAHNITENGHGADKHLFNNQ